MPSLLIVFTTYPTKESAEKVSYELLARKLAVCCQISQVASIYSWKGSVEKETEYKLTIKTSSSLFDKIQRFMEESHPYEVPEIIGIEARSASKEYLEWLHLQIDNL
ncbi:CutA-like periplasmic divalent cation tolerance protein [Encephalitozoon romaleae SJ-2008]|uniref:CutA-like periplasmic divalent cation tolerance protein n=1 Tax=Encephalitozoon romaleae (strain SJ-2008) TaxID=1178016 RepID=I6ZI53_ENCRO|nr:CutA-like periplasmic divalent cation tolerance protein [Encephalitozoon romaleae SJ-2008]AFN82903.1 CutA-like periplasmic divalent cation tolerance protein [Encephalitozoon romaleae SJ-2008]